MTELKATQFSYTRAKGFSLIELMIAAGVLAIVLAIALPMYTDYMVTARVGVMNNNIETVRLFEEDYRLSEGEYIEGTYNSADPDAVGGLKALLGWEPRTGDDSITYVVDDVSTNGFTVTATDESGATVTKTYP